MYAIHMGIPEMQKLWEELQRKVKSDKATSKDLLSENPRHPGLRTHEIDALTARYGIKVWESYLENNTPGAGRMFWVYGPDVGDITIIGLEPHPNDKSNAYKKITLSQMGNET